MAYQTYIVLALSLGSFVVGLIAANTAALGITAPWLTIVVIPASLTAFTLASNQLKTIGAGSPGTTEIKTTSVTTTPPESGNTPK